jgi:hypothetical protein
MPWRPPVDGVRNLHVVNLVAVRRPVTGWGKRLWGESSGQAAALGNTARDLSMAVGVCSVLGLTFLAVVQSAQGATWGGPLADTWFAQLAPTVSYAVPLATWCCLVGHGGLRRQRCSPWWVHW